MNISELLQDVLLLLLLFTQTWLGFLREKLTRTVQLALQFIGFAPLTPSFASAESPVETPFCLCFLFVLLYFFSSFFFSSSHTSHSPLSRLRLFPSCLVQCTLLPLHLSGRRGRLLFSCSTCRRPARFTLSLQGRNDRQANAAYSAARQNKAQG